MLLMWLPPSPSVTGAVMTQFAAASAAALMLFCRVLFPVFFKRWAAAAAITMQHGLPELCAGAIKILDVLAITLR
jgi:hypothetical protein